MKHVILHYITDEGNLADVMVDGSKILTVFDRVNDRREFECGVVSLDTSSVDGSMTFDVAESAVEVMKLVDDCDRLNRR